MPFDGITLDRQCVTNSSLRTKLEQIGLHPISQDVLKQHMAEQVARHPGNWVYRHHDSLRTVIETMARIALVGVGVSVVAMGILVIMVISDTFFGFGPDLTLVNKSIGISVGVCGLFMFMLISMGLSGDLKMIGPATWTIRGVHFQAFYQFEMPVQVRALLRRIESEMPVHSLRISYSELRETTTHELLDPIITIRHFGETEEHCLAIWDEDTVLHIA